MADGAAPTCPRLFKDHCSEQGSTPVVDGFAIQQYFTLRRQAGNPVTLSLKGVSQMVYILPERLLALVRPAFDLVLRRIRSLKRCVQA